MVNPISGMQLGARNSACLPGFPLAAPLFVRIFISFPLLDIRNTVLFALSSILFPLPLLGLLVHFQDKHRVLRETVMLLSFTWRRFYNDSSGLSKELPKRIFRTLWLSVFVSSSVLSLPFVFFYIHQMLSLFLLSHLVRTSAPIPFFFFILFRYGSAMFQQMPPARDSFVVSCECEKRQIDVTSKDDIKESRG